MPELKTVSLMAVSTSLANGEEDYGVFEFVAVENMKIVGCNFVREGATGCLTWATVQRSGNNHFMGEYDEEYQSITDDAVMFATKMDNHVTAANMSPGIKSHVQFLPSGDYFPLEKGERIYVSWKRKNSDGSSHRIVVQVALYYR